MVGFSIISNPDLNPNRWRLSRGCWRSWNCPGSDSQVSSGISSRLDSSVISTLVWKVLSRGGWCYLLISYSQSEAVLDGSRVTRGSTAGFEWGSMAKQICSSVTSGQDHVIPGGLRGGGLTVETAQKTWSKTDTSVPLLDELFLLSSTSAVTG